MRIPDFFRLGGLYIIGLAIAQVVFGLLFDDSNPNLQLAYFAVIGIYAVSIIRRGGILTYAEVLLISGIWTFVLLILDYLIISSNILLGFGMFSKAYTWIAYVIAIAAVFCFHKKRHVHIRNGGHVDSHH